MKLRTYFDITIILVFLLGAGYIFYTYLGEDNQPTDLQFPDTPKISQSKVNQAYKEKLRQWAASIGSADTEDEWYPKTLSNRWKYIKIFQNSQLSGNNDSIFKDYPNKQIKNSANFHFIISNGFGDKDGKVTVTPLWKTQTDSTLITNKSHAHESICICLIGDFNTQPPTARQAAALKALLNYLYETTTIKTYNTGFKNIPDSATKLPDFFPLDTIIKTRY